MTTTHYATVCEWLDTLASLTAGRMSLSDAKARGADMAVQIASEFPAAAFSRASLRHVAMGFPYMPSLNELSAALTIWHEEHKPRPARPELPGQSGQDLSTADRIAIEAWQERRRPPECTPGNHLSMIKKHFREAFIYLVRNDTAAHRCAWENHLMSRDEALP